MEVHLTNIPKTTQTSAVSGMEKSKNISGKQPAPQCDTYTSTVGSEEHTLPVNFMGPSAVGTRGVHGSAFNLQLKEVFEQYYSGDVDLQVVEDKMSYIVEDLRAAYVGRGFDEAEFMPKLLEDVYDSARLYNVHGAFVGSWQDSLPLAAEHNGDGVNTRDWVYYDANYYYRSESMKTTLQEITIKIGEKYGVSSSELDLPTEYPEGDVRRGIYNSYNTIVTDNARFFGVASMIDETMSPPEGFRFFYKGNTDGTDLVVPLLDAPQDEMEAAFDGALRVWYGDWSFMGRVPVRQNPDKYPISVNMFDVINNADPGGAPSEITDFLQNFDFFSQYMAGYYTKEHPRNY